MKMALEMFSEDTLSKRQALFEDAITYAKRGFVANKHLANAIKSAVLMETFDNKTHSFNKNQSDPWFAELK